MPLSTVKNFVLMVIIIVVVVVILFAIEGATNKVLSFLRKGFGTVTEGKVLQVTTDAGEDEIRVFRFTLISEEKDQFTTTVWGDFGTGEQAGFYLDSSSNLFQSNCVILTTVYHWTNPLNPYHGYIYYVSPGSIIQEGSKSLIDESYVQVAGSGCNNTWGTFSGPLPNDKIEKCYCGWLRDKTPHDCKNEYGFATSYNPLCATCLSSCPPWSVHIACDMKEEAAKAEFRDFDRTKIANTCETDSSRCNFLFSQKTNDKTQYAYQVKYGLICDANGKWQVCTEQREKNSDSVTVGSTTVTCKLDNNFFKWK